MLIKHAIISGFGWHVKHMNLIIDFDSTFISDETIDVLAGFFPDKQQEVVRLTELAMAGELSFAQALSQRVALLNIDRAMIDSVTEQLQQAITPSFLRYKEVLMAHADCIYIVSGGFKAMIEPIAASFDIAADHVLANEFIFDDQGKVIHVDQHNPLAQDGGKEKAIAQLHLSGDVVMVGDGMTDYQVYASGHATQFYAFTENCQRAAVLAKAPATANDIGVVLKAIGWIK